MSHALPSAPRSAPRRRSTVGRDIVRPSLLPVLVSVVVSGLLAGGARPALAQSATRAQLEAQARRVTDRLQALQQESDRLVVDEQHLLDEIERLEVQRREQTARLATITEDLDQVTGELDTTAARIAELDAERQRKEPLLAARLVEIYKLGHSGYTRLLFGAEDMRHVGRILRTVGAIAEVDRRQLADFRTTLAELDTARAEIGARRASIVELQSEAAAARAALDRASRERASLVTEIDDHRDSNARLVGQLLIAQQRVQGALTRLAGGEPSGLAPIPLAPFRQTLDWPVAGPVLQAFGAARTEGASSAPTGVEIGAVEGVLVQAVHDGTVSFADVFTDYGNLVIVDHGSESYSLYGFLGELAVHQGDAVAPGDLLGRVGRTPRGISALYFELRVDGEPVDPVEWLTRR